MTELSAEVGSSLDGPITVEPGYVQYLRQNGYYIKGVREAHAIESNSRDLMHVVMLIETYDRTKDDPKLDLVDDSIDLWVCSCEDFQYNESADVSDSGVNPSECGECGHIQEVKDETE